MSPNTIWADSNSAKKSFVNYIWSRLVFPLGAIVLPLSKLFIACVSRGGKVASYQGCGYCVATFAYHDCTENVDSVDNKIKLFLCSSIIPSRGKCETFIFDMPPNVRGVHSIVVSPDGVCSYMLCGVTIVRMERGRVAGRIQIANDFFTFSTS